VASLNLEFGTPLACDLNQGPAFTVLKSSLIKITFGRNTASELCFSFCKQSFCFTRHGSIP